MKDYKGLAVRYLKMNKKRSIVTITAVTIAVTVLYMILNLGWCYLLQQREELREQLDYEIVFFTENQSQIEQIMEDERVKSASVGSYFYYDYYEPVTYDNALYINTTNPYQMGSIKTELENKYGVQGTLNWALAATYMQGEEGDFFFVVIIFVLLISFIFAIFGVGVVRNSIQLFTLEQIKDYGNLRCIGASGKELKKIIYLEGSLLELSGNVIGIFTGWLGSRIAGYFLQWETGFHLVPVVPILVAFLGDLYFAMQDNAKVVIKLSPVSAIRGEYRIKKEKIKLRKNSIFGKLFGIEGDYAYKSIMRNPGRFMKTVGAMGLGMAAFVGLMGAIHTVNSKLEKLQDYSGYFQVALENPLEADGTIDDVQSCLPTTDMLQVISDMDNVTVAKQVYSSCALVADLDEYYGHYTEQYLSQTTYGSEISCMYEEGRAEMEKSFLASLYCYGYDEEDYARYQEVLVDGTLDISENGLVLVKGASVYPLELSEKLIPELVEVEYTDYKVGDTIEILDMERYRTLIAKGKKELDAEYEKERQRILSLKTNSREDEELDSEIEKLVKELMNKTFEKENALIKETREQLIREGACKTYTIEGIVSKDINRATKQQATVILPLENYYEFTGTTKSDVTGMQYHFDKFSYTEFSSTVGYEILDWVEMVSEGFSYMEIMQILEMVQKYIIFILLAIVFFMMMITFNIVNTTASNIHMRKKEFAQLRVLGVSKKHLMKMVMLEGVIQTIAANLIGIILGVLCAKVWLGEVIEIIGLDYEFPFWQTILGIVLSCLILCGSVYMPLKELKTDMASDLAMGGD